MDDALLVSVAALSEPQSAVTSFHSSLWKQQSLICEGSASWVLPAGWEGLKQPLVRLLRVLRHYSLDCVRV